MDALVVLMVWVNGEHKGGQKKEQGTAVRSDMNCSIRQEAQRDV